MIGVAHIPADYVKPKGGNEYREDTIEVSRRLKAPKAGEDKWEDI
jgi:hypothetical protein